MFITKRHAADHVREIGETLPLLQPLRDIVAGYAIDLRMCEWFVTHPFGSKRVHALIPIGEDWDTVICRRFRRDIQVIVAKRVASPDLWNTSSFRTSPGELWHFICGGDIGALSKAIADVAVAADDMTAGEFRRRLREWCLENWAAS